MKEVRKFYFGDKPVNRDTLQQFVRLLDDVLFIYGTDKSVRAQAARSTGKTFYYQYVLYSHCRKLLFFSSVDDSDATSWIAIILSFSFFAQPKSYFGINHFWMIFKFCLCFLFRRFSVELELNFLRRRANASAHGLSGATHIDDLFYLFKSAVYVPEGGYENVKANSKEAQMVRTMTKFIMDFVKNG